MLPEKGLRSKATREPTLVSQGSSPEGPKLLVPPGIQRGQAPGLALMERIRSASRQLEVGD
jgi:hypothetical protein